MEQDRHGKPVAAASPPRATTLRRSVRILLKALGVLLAIPLLYFAAALAGSIIPANSGWEEPKDGVRLLVRTNGVHTWIVMPMVRPEMDWRPLAPAMDMKDPGYFGNSIAVGYGNREFYLNTPRWADVRFGTLWNAMFGRGSSLVHVDHDHDPAPDRYQFALTVTPEQYARLTRFILASFALDGDGRSRPLIGRGYGVTDVFYEGRGPYNAFYTCNAWTGAALRAAGIRTGWWTPFAQSVTWRLE